MKQLNETIASSMDSEERRVLYSSFDYDIDPHNSHQQHLQQQHQETQPPLLFHSFSLTCSVNALYCSLSSNNGRPLCHMVLSGINFTGMITQRNFEFTMGVTDLLAEDSASVAQEFLHSSSSSNNNNGIAPTITASGSKIMWPSSLPLSRKVGPGPGSTSAIFVQYAGSFETKTSSLTVRVQPFNFALSQDLLSNFCK